MKVYTSGEVSRICKVATTTVNKWFDSGRLKGFRVPGSRHRRIPRENLVRFLRDHGIPLGALEHEPAVNVLMVSRDQETIDRLNHELSNSPSIQLTATSSGFEAGIQTEIMTPDCLVVDFDIGGVEAVHVCHNLRRREALTETTVVALLPIHGNLGGFDPSTVDEAFKKPFDPALLAERIRTMTSAKMESSYS